MHSGVISAENISDILRGISQRRRQGILEITLPDTNLRIFFIAGKIVEVVVGGSNPLAEVLDLLKDAKVVPQSFRMEHEETYKDLFLRLNELDLGVDERVFARVIKHRVLDKLYTLELGLGAYYAFKVEMVDLDKDFSPSVSVGQLLLDFVALQSDREAFFAVFPDGVFVGRTDKEETSLSEEEEILYDLLEGSVPLERLRSCSLLSTYHFRDALLSMHKRAAIEVREGQKASATSMVQTSISLEEVSRRSDAVQEEEVESSAEDDDTYVPQASMRVKMTALSVELANVDWVPHLIVGGFLLLATLSPYLFWAEILYQFRTN